MPEIDLDTKVLSDFLYALNIARRQVIAYPPGHPMIAQAADKLIALLTRLLEFRSDVTIGIARDTLLVDGRSLDAGNPVHRDLATSLFDARVASLTISRGVTAGEVRHFFEILRTPAEKVAASGGLERLLPESGIHGIRAQGIDYRSFHATEVDELAAPNRKLMESETAVLWKAFATGVAAGTLDPDGVRQLPAQRFDPELLAEVLNSEFASPAHKVTGDYDQAIADFLRQTDRVELSGENRREAFDRLGQFIERLNPELRRRFLNSTLTGLPAKTERAVEMLTTWPQATIVEALEMVDANLLQVPQTLLDVLGKLASHRQSSANRSQVVGNEVRSKEDTAGLVSKLFQSDEQGRYVPADYQDALAVLAAADVASDLDPTQVGELLDTLGGHAVERQFCAVMLDLIEREIGANSARAINRNLEELVNYFLDSGDFASLNSIHHHLARHVQQGGRLAATPEQSALNAYGADAFVCRVLDELEHWGKEQYPVIQELICRVGEPFVAPLLDRLAEEPAISRRRLYMECLQQLGPRALVPIVKRLSDPRWYVVRNLVILLRGINAAEALQPLGSLIGHPHPKVQSEVIRTFLHFNDPRAERFLLRLIESRDPAVVIGATRLAAGSRNPEIARRLAGLLCSRGFSEQELALKEALIKTLAEMGCKEALPGLAAFIEGRNLFMSAAVQRLKIEAVLSLVRYAVPAARALADRLSHKLTGEIARAAGQVCRQLQGTQP